MTPVLERLFISIVRCFCISQKQRGVADAVIEADNLLLQRNIYLCFLVYVVGKALPELKGKAWRRKHEKEQY
jgi:hypothetical protein